MGLLCKNCHAYNPGNDVSCRKCHAHIPLSENYKRCTFCHYVNPVRIKKCINCGNDFGLVNQVKVVFGNIGKELSKNTISNVQDKKFDINSLTNKPQSQNNQRFKQPSSVMEWVQIIQKANKVSQKRNESNDNINNDNDRNRGRIKSQPTQKVESPSSLMEWVQQNQNKSNIDGSNSKSIIEYKRTSALSFFINSLFVIGFVMVIIAFLVADQSYNNTNNKKISSNLTSRAEINENLLAQKKLAESIEQANTKKAQIEEDELRKNGDYSILINELLDGVDVKEMDILNNPNIICPIKKADAVNFKNELEVNNKKFSANYYCLNFKDRCDEVVEENEAIKKELDRNIYTIVNGCLYKEDKSIFTYNLLLKKELGYFDGLDNLENQVKPIVEDLWNSVYEIFRYEDNNKLFIYLGGKGDCGSCIYNGPFLEIDSVNNNIIGGSMDLPYTPNLFVYLNSPKAVEVVFDYTQDKSDITLYTYDILKGERENLIYKIPSDKTILVIDSKGIHPIKDSIIWLTRDVISVQQYERSSLVGQEAIVNDAMVGWKSNRDGYIKSGRPKTLSIQPINNNL